MSKEIKEEKSDYEIIEGKLINKINNKDFNTNNSKEKNSIKDSKLLQNRTKSNLSSRQYSNSNIISQNKIEKPTKIKSSNLIAIGYCKGQKRRKEDYFKLKTLTKISKNKKFKENSKNFYFNVNQMTESTASFYNRNINAINNKNIHSNRKFPDLINGIQKNKNKKNIFTPDYIYSSPTREEIIKRSKSYLSNKENRDIYNNEVNSYFSPRMFSYIKKPEQKFKKMASIGRINTNICISPSTTNNSIINTNNSSSHLMNKNSFTSNIQKSKDNNITVYIEDKVKKMTAIEYQLNQLLAKKEQKEKEKEKEKAKYKIDKFNHLIDIENNNFNLDDLYLNYLKHIDDNSYRDYAFQVDNYSLRKNNNSKKNYAKLSNNYNDNFINSNENINNHDTTYGDSSYRLWLSKNINYKNNNTDNSKIISNPKIRYSFLDKVINKINRKVSVVKPHSVKEMDLNLNKNTKNKNLKDFITYGYELTPEILFKIKQLHENENLPLKKEEKKQKIIRPTSTFSLSEKKYKKKYEESKNIDKEKNYSISKNYITDISNKSPNHDFLECLGESSNRNKLDWNLISEADKEQGRILWKKLSMVPKPLKASAQNIHSKTSKKELKNIISNIQKNAQNNIYKVINTIKDDRINAENNHIKNKYSNNNYKNDKSSNINNIDINNNFSKIKNINNKNIIGLKKETKDYNIYNTKEKKDCEIEKENNKNHYSLLNSKLKEVKKNLNQNQKIDKKNLFKIEKQKGILSISYFSNNTIEENKGGKNNENESINEIEIGIEEKNNIKKEDKNENEKEKENIKKIEEIEKIEEVKEKINEKNVENIKEKENDVIKEKEKEEEEEKDKKMIFENNIKIKKEINIFINRTNSKKATKRQSLSKNKINTRNSMNLKRDSFFFSSPQKNNIAKIRFKNQYKNQDIIDLLDSEHTSSKDSKNKSNKTNKKKYNNKYLFHKKRKKIYNLKKKEELRNEKYQKKNPNIVVRKNQSFILEDNPILNGLIPKKFKDNNISSYINDEIDYWSDDNSKRCKKFKQQVLILSYFPKRENHTILYENLYKNYKTKQHNDEEKMNKYYDEIYNKYGNESQREEELINISIYGLELKITKKMQKNYYKRFMHNVKQNNKIQRDQKRNNRRLTLILDKYNLSKITEDFLKQNLSKNKRKSMINKDKIKRLSILKTNPAAPWDDDSECNEDKEISAWKERINEMKKIEKKNLEALLKLKNDIKFKIKEGKINDTEMEKYIQFQKRINDLTLSGINNGFHMGLVEEGFDSFEDELRMNEEKRQEERRINSFIDSMTYDLNYHFRRTQKENLLHVIDFKIKNFVNVLSPIKINPKSKSIKKINKIQKKKQEL